MATLEQRLQRQDWDPKPEDILIGEIIKISERETQYGHYPLLVVRDEQGVERNVHCSRGGLLWPVVNGRPAIGDRIGIRYDGSVGSATGGKDSHRYGVEFENETDAEPDWDRIAASRDRDKTPEATSAENIDPWANASEPDWPDPSA